MSTFVKLVEEKVISRYQPPVCAICEQKLVSVDPEYNVDSEGLWTALQAHNGIKLTLTGGYGMAVDPIGSYLEEYQLLICQECIKKTPWLNKCVEEINNQW